MRLTVICPHFDPDTAPTGRVMSRIVAELAALGHELHVVTSVPWYRRHAIEPGWERTLVRTERVPWGSITRVHPFSGGDKRNLVRRAAGFVGFSALAGVRGVVAGGRGRVDAVLVMSPPLTLGPVGWLVKLVRRAPLVFNVQDIFPDAAVETGAITNRRVVAVAAWLERFTYARSDAVTVLSDDLAANVRSKLRPERRATVHVIPNFVDTDEIRPSSRHTRYRGDLGIGDEHVVMYAGNVGFSQSLDLVIAAARRLPEVTFVINGEGAARADLERAAAGLANVRFVDYQAVERLPEVLASADVHVVPLRRGLGSVSVPSKTYSVLAAGRPVVAAIDPDTEVPRLLAASGGGVAVPPDDPVAFVNALVSLLDDEDAREAMGRAGRTWAETEASARSVGRSYESLVQSLLAGVRRRPGRGLIRRARR